MLLGTAAHALDFDDVAFGGHVSAVLVPTLLASSLARPVSGVDFARAYVAGYEVWSELATRDRDMYHRRGFHPTPVLGAVAAAGAVEVLELQAVEPPLDRLHPGDRGLDRLGGTDLPRGDPVGDVGRVARAERVVGEGAHPLAGDLGRVGVTRVPAAARGVAAVRAHGGGDDGAVGRGGHLRQSAVCYLRVNPCATGHPRGGHTALDNHAPLCTGHHHVKHDGGWTVRLTLARPSGSTKELE